MTHILAIHSFRRGTGKSTLTANLAALLAAAGRRVGVVDTNLQSPSLHILFGLPDQEIQHTLNDYVWGRAPIRSATYDVTTRLRHTGSGQIWLTPASATFHEIAHALREDFDAKRLGEGFQQLANDLKLDVILADTHAGVSDATLTTIALADAVLICLRPDEQDYQGTALIVELARKLNTPRIQLLLNEVPQTFDLSAVAGLTEKVYQSPVVAVLPHLDEWMALGSAELFVLRYPHHLVTRQLTQLAEQLLMEV